jgi:hypothetical protein
MAQTFWDIHSQPHAPQKECPQVPIWAATLEILQIMRPFTITARTYKMSQHLKESLSVRFTEAYENTAYIGQVISSSKLSRIWRISSFGSCLPFPFEILGDAWAEHNPVCHALRKGCGGTSISKVLSFGSIVGDVPVWLDNRATVHVQSMHKPRRPRFGGGLFVRGSGCTPTILWVDNSKIWISS